MFLNCIHERENMEKQVIIGFRSEDGVAVGSDRKLLRGMEVEYSPKYFIFEPVVFVAEGLTGIIDDFYYILRGELERRRGDIRVEDNR